MTAPQPPGGPGPADGKGKAKGGLLAAVKRSPALAVVGAAGLAAVIVLARRKNPAAAGQDTAAGNGATGYADTGTATPYSYGGYGGDSGYDNQMAGLQSQLQALTTQVSTLTGQERAEGRRKPGPRPRPRPRRRRRRPGGGPHPPGGKTGIRGGH